MGTLCSREGAQIDANSDLFDVKDNPSQHHRRGGARLIFPCMKAAPSAQLPLNRPNHTSTAGSGELRTLNIVPASFSTTEDMNKRTHAPLSRRTTIPNREREEMQNRLMQAVAHGSSVVKSMPASTQLPGAVGRSLSRTSRINAMAPPLFVPQSNEVKSMAQRYTSTPTLTLTQLTRRSSRTSVELKRSSSPSPTDGVACAPRDEEAMESVVLYAQISRPWDFRRRSDDLSTSRRVPSLLGLSSSVSPSESTRPTLVRRPLEKDRVRKRECSLSTQKDSQDAIVSRSVVSQLDATVNVR